MLKRAACATCGGPRDREGQRNCRPCHAAYMREWRKTHPLTGEALKRANARSYANVNLKRGKIMRRPCADCGGPGENMHHENYDRPNDVTWLCKPCHYARHRKTSNDQATPAAALC